MPEINRDTELVDLLRSNKSEGFLYLYQHYFSMCKYFIVRNSGTTNDAEDVFQDVLLVLYHQTQSADFRLTCSLKTYIYSVMRNLWLKQLKKNSKQIRLTDYEKHIVVNEEEVKFIEKDEQYNILEKAILLLGENCKKILQLFYVENESMQVIAEKMGYTNADNVKTQKYKCLQQLKKHYSEADE